MESEKNKKRKNRNSSGNGSGDINDRKLFKGRGPSGDLESITSVSDVLNQTNAVLYDENFTDSSVFTLNSDSTCLSEVSETMAEKSDKEPTNRELMNCMLDISKRLGTVELKLGTLDQLEKKVTGIEKELNNIWVSIDDRTKKIEERVSKIEDKVDSDDIGAALLASKVDNLEKARDDMRDEVAYLKSQSMRNNLIFTNITEDNSSGLESYETTEKLLRQHLQDKLWIAKEMAESIRFERVHRSPGHTISGKVRNIVAKFIYFKDREFVRKQWKHISGTKFSMYEQFPPEVIAKRKKLIPKMKKKREEGKQAWIAYDTLYVNGRPDRD